MATACSRDGTTIEYVTVGAGPSTILIGGAFTTLSTLEALAGSLAQRLSVFSYDRRGRRESGDAGPYRVEREVEDLEAVIDEAGGSAFVFGHSSGAALAIEAVARGLAIEKLAVYEPPFIVDDSRPPLPSDFAEHLSDLIGSRRRGDAVEYFLTTGVGLAAEVVATFRNAATWTAMEELAHTLVYDATILRDTTLGTPLPTSWATSVAIPTLVMDGAKSEPWQRHATESLAALLSSARHYRFPDADHRVGPEVIAPVLVEFFCCA